MKPRMYAISIDYKTKTYKNLMDCGFNIVLQALSSKNIDQVRVLERKVAISMIRQNIC